MQGTQGIQGIQGINETRLSTEEVWQEFSTQLRRFVRSRVRDEQAADDIVQDVFLRIHTHGAALHHQEKLASWLYQIARHTIADYFRRQLAEPTHPLPHDAAERFAASDDDPTDAHIRALLPCVRAMVQALPTPYREALQMTEYDGLTQQALAQRSGLSLSGAKSRVQRARDKLRMLLLACCHLEFDHAGRVVDYHPDCACCGSGACAPTPECATDAGAGGGDDGNACVAAPCGCGALGAP
jgi:RNA polymerase sigma-70 factor (ECF subfamily)